MTIQYDMQIKILMIGDSGVGKTSMLIRFANDKYSQTFISTIGIDFKIKNIQINDKMIKLQIWDTADQERFRTITTSYFRSAQGIVLVYDVTDKQSFASIKHWLYQIQLHSDSNVNKILVGNKCDNIDERVVSYDEGMLLAKENNIDFFECSAKSDININKIYTTLTEQVVTRLSINVNTKSNIIIRPNQPIIKKKCC